MNLLHINRFGTFVDDCTIYQVIEFHSNHLIATNCATGRLGCFLYNGYKLKDGEYILDALIQQDIALNNDVIPMQLSPCLH